MSERARYANQESYNESPEKNQDFLPYERETKEQKTTRVQQEQSDSENQYISEELLEKNIEGAITRENNKRIVHETIQTYTYILTESGISKSEIREAMNEVGVGEVHILAKPALILLALGNIAQKHEILLSKNLYKHAALSLRDVHEGLSQESEVGDPNIFPNIYYHYIELLPHKEALEFIESILQMKMYKKKELYEFSYLLNFKAELLREVGNIEEAHTILESSIKNQEQAKKYDPFTLINYTENLIARFENTQDENEKKKLGVQILRYQNIVRNLPLIIHSQTEAENRNLSLSEAKEAQVKMEDLVNGIIHAKLARISYIREPKRAKQQLDFYFGDEYEIIDTVGNEKYNFGINLLSKLGLYSSPIKESGLGSYLLKDKNKKNIFIFRGTEISREHDWTKTDTQDLITNIQILVRKMPIKQIENILKFIETNTQLEDSITFVGHSLGGFLAQVVSVIYKHQLEKSYVFNAPGAWGYEFKNHNISKKYMQKLNDFRKENYEKAFLHYKIINYDSKKDRIGNHGGDIGRRITISNENHSIFHTEETMQGEIFDSLERKGFGESYIYKHSLKIKKILEFHTKNTKI